MTGTKIHPSAEVSSDARIGGGTQIWNNVQIRGGAVLGSGCIIGKNVYIDFNVSVGSLVKIQNNASLFHGAIVEDGVFIGPHVCLTNDKIPRAVNPDFTIKGDDDWIALETIVRKGASIGAGSIILPGVEIGEYALVGAGSIVTKDVPNYGLVLGNPARLTGYVCRCGQKFGDSSFKGQNVCKSCGHSLRI